MILAWAVFPVVLGALCLGLGELAARTVGRRPPAALLVPYGFAAMIVIASLTTSIGALAPFTVPLVVGLGVVGVVLAPRRDPTRATRVALAAGATTFLLFGAPVLLSGEPTFTGYVKLDDTATFLAFADRVLDHGRDLDGLPPSSYEATLAVNVANGYPLGAVLPLGIGARLVGTDPAWVWQPYLCFAAALLAVTLAVLAQRLTASVGRPGVLAVGASASALYYGYALWGGIKELVAVPLLALAAVTVEREKRAVSEVVLPVVALAGFLGVMSVGGLVWVMPLALAHLLVTHGTRLRRSLVGAGLFVVLTLPVIAEAGAFLRADNVTSFRSGEELGNLVRPLHVRQILGIWPTADFRVDPEHGWLTALLLLVAVLGLIAGLLTVVRGRRWDLAALLASVTLGAVVFVTLGSPWLGGKALAMASPVVLLVVLCGLLCPPRATWRRAGVVLGSLVLAGVLVSDALAYRGVWLAPYDQLSELEMIGKRFAGQGPALMTEYQPYGVRHFLRALDAEGASELRRRQVPLADGSLVPKGGFADIDRFDQREIIPTYRLLVLRRSPVGSRPSSTYELAFRGRWYDVWRRVDAVVPARLALGTELDRNGVPTCGDVKALVSSSPGSRIVVPQQASATIAGVYDPLPKGWAETAPGIVAVGGPGEVRVPIQATGPGRFGVWVGGSSSRRLHILVDGRSVGWVGPHINQAGMWIRAGDMTLGQGPHTVTLRAERDRLHPGVVVGPFSIGPVALAEEPSGALEQVDDPHALCRRSVDWVELAR